MFQENFYKINKNFSMSSGFGDKRNYGKHEGFDYTSVENKKQNIYNLLSGQVYHFGYSEKSGNYIVFKHNFKFLRGVDDYFFTAYRHLSEIDILIDFRYSASLRNNIVSPGEIIGKMGNTGYSLTFEKKKWRELTDQEKSDPKEKKGVHLHFEIFQFTSEFNITPLIQLFLDRKWAKKEQEFYFYRGGKLFINPDLIMSYARYLLVEGE